MTELLLVTGKLAEPQVRECAQKLNADVLALPVSVAQFITPQLAISEIKALRRSYGKIIFPGLTRFDVSKVETVVKMPCFKGPEHPSDLPEVIWTSIHLSKTKSADSLLAKRGTEAYKEATAKAEKGPAKFTIGDLRIGTGFPPRVIAEVVDAPALSDEQVLSRAHYYLASGADIIDVGAIAAEDNSERLAELVRLLKKELEAPISIDSLNLKEINAAIRAGADLVLSLCARNMGSAEKSDGVAYVVIAEDGDEKLEDNLRRAQELGFRNLIADPILAPPFRIAESISQYYGFRKASAQPMMLGVGNVVELMDVDSPGLNGLLATMAVELDASLLLTTENSQKTRNSVRELKRAIEMAFLAKSKGTLPKDLGFDLLLAKSKGGGVDFDIGKVKVVQVPDTDPTIELDPKGYFNIFVDFKKGQIIAAHFKDKYDHVFSGTSAEAVSKEIIDKHLVSDLKHAAYLGRELQKAEMYLKLGRGYIQDEDFSGL